MPAPPPSWDQYFYAMAEVAKTRSKDPNSPVGAVIVSAERVVLATGYNGPARGVMDRPERILSSKEEKLRWMCHAEANATFNATRAGTILTGSTMYVTKFPCVACAGAIVQAGLRRVYTEGDFWRNDPSGDDGSRAYTVLAEAGVQIHAPNLTGCVHLGDGPVDESIEEARRIARQFAHDAAVELANQLADVLKRPRIPDGARGAE
jgi:dCMP deaminase